MSQIIKVATCAFSSLQSLFCSISSCSKVSVGHVSCLQGAGGTWGSSPGHQKHPQQCESHCGSHMDGSSQALPVDSPTTVLSANHQACGCSQGGMFCQWQLCLFPSRPRVSLPAPASSTIRDPSSLRRQRYTSSTMRTGDCRMQRGKAPDLKRRRHRRGKP